jgi:C1A family cysteine protease
MKVLSILIISALAASAIYSLASTSNNQVDSHFGNYMTQFNKNYQTTEEFEFRKTIFAENLAIIEAHNAKGLSWWMGTNQFTDWTKEEYKRMLGYKKAFKSDEETHHIRDMPDTNCVNYNSTELSQIDWRQHGLVTPVKNQGACGSCWAFSAVGSLEGAYAKAFGMLESFSELQLVECNKFSHGCNGGLMTNGFIHWMHNAPRTESDYPYTPSPSKCKEASVRTIIPELKWGYRVDISWQCLYEALTHNTVSVSIRAENDDFRNYKGGVIDGKGCGEDLDHGVTLVGYNATEDAWIVKNSWSASWGEEGYVRIRRAEGNGVCGINQENAQAVYQDEEYKH